MDAGNLFAAALQPEHGTQVELASAHILLQCLLMGCRCKVPIKAQRSQRCVCRAEQVVRAHKVHKSPGSGAPWLRC